MCPVMKQEEPGQCFTFGAALTVKPTLLSQLDVSDTDVNSVTIHHRYYYRTIYVDTYMKH